MINQFILSCIVACYWIFWNRAFHSVLIYLRESSLTKVMIESDHSTSHQNSFLAAMYERYCESSQMTRILADRLISVLSEFWTDSSFYDSIFSIIFSSSNSSSIVISSALLHTSMSLFYVCRQILSDWLVS
jgi:hypothetical protein